MSELEELERQLTSLETNQTSAPPPLSKGGGGKAPLRPQAPSRRYEGDEQTRKGMIIAAATAFGVLILGGGFWFSYNQGLMRGSEQVAPLIKPSVAVKQPPEEPGGMTIPEQNAQIYNRMEGKDAQPKVEQLLAPPEEPQILNKANDQANSTMNNLANNQPNNQAMQPISPPPPTAPVVMAPSSNMMMAQPLPTKPAPEKNTPVAMVGPSKTTEKATNQSANNVPVKMENGGGNGFRVQIAALPSVAEAKDYWRSMQSRHGDLLGGLALSLEEVLVKDKTYYRVRGGVLSDLAKAEALCGKLKTRGQACLVIKP